MKLKIIIAIIVLLGVAHLNFNLANAQEESYCFELSIDGKDTKEVNTGDIITIVLRLRRTDIDSSYMMYAMQDEIYYDSSFFELVENSEILNQGIGTTDIAMRDQYRAFYMNYVSFSGGEQWDNNMFIGSFQLRVIGTSGVTHIKNENYLVSFQDGSDSYFCEAKDIKVILSTDCTINFYSNGGNEVEQQIVQYGEKVQVPKNVVREGFRLEGWYRDIDLTEKWNFEEDVVKENMSLYAKWVADEPVEDQMEQKGQCWICWLLLLIIILITSWIIYKKIKKKEQIQ